MARHGGQGETGTRTGTGTSVRHGSRSVDGVKRDARQDRFEYCRGALMIGKAGREGVGPVYYGPPQILRQVSSWIVK